MIDLIQDGPFAGLERGRYAVAQIDCPWHFHGGGTRTPQNHYRTMTIREIRALPVKDILAPACAVFVWTYWPLLDMAIDIGKRSWGLKYCSSAFVWVKIRQGASDALWLDKDKVISTGYTTRKNTEVCLLFKRRALQRQRADIQELIFAPRREHSRKPEEAYRRIELLYGDVPRIDIFSRERRRGWHNWGNQSELFNGGDGSGLGRGQAGAVAGAPREGKNGKRDRTGTRGWYDPERGPGQASSDRLEPAHGTAAAKAKARSFDLETCPNPDAQA